MSDIDTIRAIVGDPVQFDRTQTEGDGFTTEYATANAPVVIGSQKVFVNAVLQALGPDYTFDSEAGLVTFVTPPAVNLQVVVSYRWSYQSDATLQTLLNLSPANLLLAASRALDAMATNEAIVQKVMRMASTSTDGRAVAQALRDHAKELRLQANAEDGGFDWAEMVTTMPAWRERILDEWAREG